MKKLFPFLALLVFPMFGNAQSGIYNVPYKPQPRILIPHVEARQTIITTGGVVENPYRSLKFCDFVLKAVDQSGKYADGSSGNHPVIWCYASSVTNAQTGGATVFFQDASAEWPLFTQRKQYQEFSEVGWFWVETTNSPPSVSDYPPYIDVDFPGGGNTMCGNSFTGRLNYVEGTNTWGGLHYGSFPFGGNPWFNWTGSTWVFAIGREQGNQGGITNQYISMPNLRHRYQSVQHESIAAASQNKAGAIEVYPVRRSWMKQGNPDIKWMCKLSNGIDFYRDAPGAVVWFNCVTEWVQKAPKEGVWE